MSPSDTPYRHSDELLDELDATFLLLGRLMAARHSGHCEGDLVVTGPRLVGLRILQEVGASKAGDLASCLGIKPPAMSSLLDALERDGLIARDHDPDDRRVTLVTVTDNGSTVLREAEERRREHMRVYLEVLSEDDIRSLIRIQRKLIEAMIDQDA